MLRKFFGANASSSSTGGHGDDGERTGTNYTANSVAVPKKDEYLEDYVAMTRMIQRAYFEAAQLMASLAKRKNRKRILAEKKDENSFLKFVQDVLAPEPSVSTGGSSSHAIVPSSSSSQRSIESQIALSQTDKMPNVLRLTQTRIEGWLTEYEGFTPAKRLTATEIQEYYTWLKTVDGDLAGPAAHAIEIAEAFMRKVFALMIDKEPTTPTFLVAVYFIEILQKISGLGYAKQQSAYHLMFCDLFIDQLKVNVPGAYSVALRDSGNDFLTFLNDIQQEFKYLLQHIAEKTVNKGIVTAVESAIVYIDNAIELSMKAMGVILSNEKREVLRDTRAWANMNFDEKTTRLEKVMNLYSLKVRAKATLADQYATDVMESWLKEIPKDRNITPEELKKILKDAMKKHEIPSDKIKNALQHDIKTIVETYAAMINPDETNVGIDADILYDEVNGTMNHESKGMIWRWFSILQMIVLIKKCRDSLEAFMSDLVNAGEYTACFDHADDVNLAFGGIIPTLTALHDAQENYWKLVGSEFLGLRQGMQQQAGTSINSGWLHNCVRAKILIDKSNTQLYLALAEVEAVIQMVADIHQKPAQYMFHVTRKLISAAASAHIHGQEMSMFYSQNQLQCITDRSHLVDQDPTVAAMQAGLTSQMHRNPSLDPSTRQLPAGQIDRSALLTGAPAFNGGRALPGFMNAHIRGDNEGRTLDGVFSTADQQALRNASSQDAHFVQDSRRVERGDLLQSSQDSAHLRQRGGAVPRIEEVQDLQPPTLPTPANRKPGAGGGGEYY